jgi:hypothetical protein
MNRLHGGVEAFASHSGTTLGTAERPNESAELARGAGGRARGIVGLEPAHRRACSLTRAAAYPSDEQGFRSVAPRLRTRKSVEGLGPAESTSHEELAGRRPSRRP